MSADELKAKGNAAMAQNNFVDAVKYYSDAIALDPNNYVLYSNRSAAQVSLGNFEDALQDGEKTVSINPGWGKVLQHHKYFSLFFPFDLISIPFYFRDIPEKDLPFS